MQNRKNSDAIYTRLSGVMPGGVSSPVRACLEHQMTPLVVSRAEGAYLFDVDDNQYLDYCMSWGALIHGHAHPVVIEAALTRLREGSSFGCTTPYEEALASKVISHMPACEKVRFVSSGTEATMSAIRLARGFTGRSGIIKFQGAYHGHADAFLVQAGSGSLGLNGTSTSLGIPKEHIQWTACLPYNDIQAFDQYVKQHAASIACVIVEPIATNMGLVPPKEGFLHTLRQRTKEIGALLIFDEVVTGFRVGLGGAAAYYGITPDLICLGKIIGGGMPCACFGGRAEIMNALAPLGEVYQAGTLSGNPVAVGAGFTAISLAERPHFYEELERKTASLVMPIQEYLQKKSIPACMQHRASLCTLFFGKTHICHAEDTMSLDRTMFKKFFRYMFERGVYIPPGQQEVWAISAAHTQEDIERTREVILAFLQEVYL